MTEKVTTPPGQQAANGLALETLVSTNSIKAQLALAEPVLFLYGFSKSEQVERPPALLRGTLIVRVLKPTKIKGITLKFRGISRTEWPEGIPPKKTETFESKDLYSHVWPFFDAHHPGADQTSGAHVVVPLAEEHAITEGINGSGIGDHSSTSVNSAAGNGSSSSGPGPARGRSRSNTIENKAKTVFSRNKGMSPAPNVKLSLSSGVLKPTMSVGPGSQSDTASKGYRQFQPAEYLYNFELAIPQMLQETTRCNFGHVKYAFDLQIDRSGTFKSNLVGNKELTILRSLAMSNLESSEPIVISRDWEDLLHYEIIIAGKAFAIGGSIPIAFSLVPLAKVKCHRIRVYITEHTEYFCKHKKVHRVEPVHKFLLLEKTHEDGLHSSLINTDTGMTSMNAYEFNVKIPAVFKHRRDKLRPNANVGTIKVHHWIKVVLRLSKGSPDPVTGKTKYYEVSIDSPITLLDPRTVQANTLPQYITEPGPSSSTPQALRAYQEYVDNSNVRPIHLMRKPSIAPPPFDAEDKPPSLAPPNYDALKESPQSYRRRFEAYQAAHEDDDSGTPGPETASGHSGHSGHSSDTPTESSVRASQPHFSEIIWRDDGDDEATHSPGDSGSGAHSPGEHAHDDDDHYHDPRYPRMSVVGVHHDDDHHHTVDEEHSPERESGVQQDDGRDPPPEANFPPANELFAARTTWQPISRVESPVVGPLGEVPEPATAVLPDPASARAAAVAVGAAGAAAGAAASDDALQTAPQSPAAILSPSVTSPGVASPGVASPGILSPGVLSPSVSPAAVRVSRTDNEGLSPSSFSAREKQAIAAAVFTQPLSRQSSASSAFSAVEERYMPLSPRTSISQYRGPNLGSAGSGWARRPSTAGGPAGGTSRESSVQNIPFSRLGSTSSSRTRYFRQSSMVSVDLAEQGHSPNAGLSHSAGSRRASRVNNLSEIQDVTDWYHRNNSESSLGVSVNEYEGPDRSPLLGHTDPSELDLADYDYEDDMMSIRSGRSSSIVRPQVFI